MWAECIERVKKQRRSPEVKIMLPHPRNIYKRGSYGLSIGGSREFKKTCYVDSGI